MIRTYSELCKFQTFKERFEYLRLDGQVGQSTFGFDRYLNQIFYKTKEWKSMRNKIIIRDDGCDLGIEGRDIYGRIYIHHMNPLMVKDLLDRTDLLLNPEYLICTSFNTHQAIHYSDENLLILDPVDRKPNDTCPWKNLEIGNKSGHY